MGSKAVDGVLRDAFWPLLKSAGFARRTGRATWRDRDHAVQCVSVQSFNTYTAGVLGATTFSFGVGLGVFYPAIADRLSVGAFVRDRTRPRDFECHIRKFVTKGIAQPNVVERRLFGLVQGQPTLGAWKERPDVWLVLGDGSNVQALVADAAGRVESEGLPWLERLAEPAEAIRCLFEEPDRAEGGVPTELYGGTVGSPARWSRIGALACLTKDMALLERALDEMDKQPYFKRAPHDLNALRAELASLT